jgi:PAS domain S-box-containing protein
MKYKDDIQERIAAKVVGTLSPWAIVATVGVAVAVMFAVPVQWTRVFPSVVAAALLLLDWWLVRIGRIRAAAHLLVAIIVAAMLTGMVLNGGTQSMIFSGVPLILIAVVGWLYGLRTAVLCTIGCVVVGGFFVWLDARGLLREIPQASALTIWLTVSCYLPLMLAATAIPDRMLHQALAESEERRRDAEEAQERALLASRALSESEERYRNFVANAREGIFRIDFTEDVSIDQAYAELETQIGECAFIAEVNEALSNMYGMSPEQMTGLPVRQFAPDCGKQMADLVQNEDYRISELESQEYDIDGNQITIVEGYTGIVEQGVLKRVWGVQRDISDRKRADEERFRLWTAVEQAAELIVITDTDGTIQYVNPSFEKVTGYSRLEAVGNNPRLLKSGMHDESFYRTMWDTIKGGDNWKGRLTNKRKDGNLYEEEAVISPIRDDLGSIVSFVAVKRDVTQELALEGQLLQAQKMEAVGQLAGGVAHDFNNLLTVITGYAEIIESSLAHDDPLVPEIAEISKAADSAAELTGQLLAFSRKQIIDLRVIELDEVISRSQKMLGRIIGEDVDLVFRPGIDVGRIKADPAQIDQILVNLAVNARDAMPEGGRLVIETLNIHREDVYVPMGEAGAELPRDYVMLVISDDGAGMDDATIERIFEPFFSTKGHGRGSGLGLSTVYGIVAQHNGYVRVSSELGVGTRFEVCFPRVLEQACRVERVDRTDLPRGTETVLLVEDEDVVRRLARKVLERQGYQVIEAVDGGDACRQSKAYDGEIHLLLTDVVMPNMNGRDLHVELLKTRPGIRGLFMSGYTDDVIAHHGVLDDGVDFMQKPFTAVALARKVRDVLDG